MFWANQRIVDVKLQNPNLRDGWRHLLAFTYVIEAVRQERFPKHTDPYYPTDVINDSHTRWIRERLDEPKLGDQEST
jgi:hypothetical protein